MILSIYTSILSKYKSTLSIQVQKYTCKVQKCPFKVQKYAFEVQKYTFKLQKYTFKVQKCPFKVQKYAFEVQKYTFKLQSNFRNLGNRISGIRNLLNTFGSRNPVPRTSSVQTSRTEPNPSVPIEHRNFQNATFWTRNLETAKPVGTHRSPDPVPRTASPEPQNLSPGTGSRNPVPSRNRPSSPRTHRNLWLWCKDPIAFCCWGKRFVPYQRSRESRVRALFCTAVKALVVAVKWFSAFWAFARDTKTLSNKPPLFCKKTEVATISQEIASNVQIQNAFVTSCWGFWSTFGFQCFLSMALCQSHLSQKCSTNG